ncbi:MAG: hypothetical protein WBF06_10845 [Candidatus Acidiferrales bacterium]
MLQQKTHFEQVALETVTAIVETEAVRQKASEQLRETTQKKSAQFLLEAGTSWKRARSIAEVNKS